MTKVWIGKPLEWIAITAIGTAEQISLRCGGATVTVFGSPSEVRSLVENGPPADALSDIQRALNVLGYPVGNHQKDAETFSRWIDGLNAYAQSEEVKATFTEAMLRLMGGPNPPLTPETMHEAAGACAALVQEQMRLFPPRARTELDDGPELPQMSDARERSWQMATGASEPGEVHNRLRGFGGVFGAVEQIEKWRESTNALAPEQAASTIKTLREASVLMQRTIVEWHDETGQESPKLAGQRIASLMNDRDDLSKRLGSLLSERELWRVRTNQDRPEDVVPESHWINATQCQTPTGAGELLRQRVERIKELEAKLAESERCGEKAFGIAQSMAWQSCTGRETPRDARDMIGKLRSELDEATTKLAQRGQDYLAACAEVDKVRKAARTLGLVSDDAKEIAKLRAELQSKCREAQTERERADAVDSMFRVEQQKHNDTRAELATRTNEWRAQVTRADAAKRERNDAFDALNKIRDAILKKDATRILVGESWTAVAALFVQVLDSAIIPLPKPEKVEPGQKWAALYTVTDTSLTRDVRRATLGGDSRAPLESVMLAVPGWIYLGKS